MTVQHKGFALPAVERDEKTGEFVVRRGPRGVELARCSEAFRAYEIAHQTASQDWPPKRD